MIKFKTFKNDSGEVKSVKLGFSWPGFFGGPIWALTKRLWIVIAGMITLKPIFMLMILAFCPLIEAGELNFIGNILNVLIWVSPGFFGNKLLEKQLIRAGYKEVE